MSIESLASLNNAGAKCILQNNKDYDGAIFYFLQTMKQVKLRLNEGKLSATARSSQRDGKEGCREKQSSYTGSRIQHTLVDVVGDESLSPLSSSSSSSDIFVFKRVFVVTSFTCGCNAMIEDGNEDNGGLISSLLKLATYSVYNLGLAHHLSGLHFKCRQRLERARTYYELSFKLLREEQKTTTLPSSLPSSLTNEQDDDRMTMVSAEGLLHCLSVMNNVGAISLVLDDEEMSSKIFGQLLKALTYIRENKINDTNKDGSTNSWLQGNWMNGFWNNAATSVLCSKSTITARAA